MSVFFDQNLGKYSSKPSPAPVAETSPDTKSTRAPLWVVFSGQTDLPWLHVLRPGYRHCFVLLYQRGQWLICDPLASHTEITLTDLPGDFDLPRWYARQGMSVWQVIPPPPQPRSQHWRLFSCVEAVKRLLGIRACLVFTPWQLMRHLRQHHQARRIMPGKNLS